MNSPVDCGVNEIFWLFCFAKIVKLSFIDFGALERETDGFINHVAPCTVQNLTWPNLTYRSHKWKKNTISNSSSFFLTGCFGVSFSEKLVFGSWKVTQGHNNPKINTIEMNFKNLLFWNRLLIDACLWTWNFSRWKFYLLQSL